MVSRTVRLPARRALGTVLVALLFAAGAPGTLLAPGPARADGDPASDVLLGDNVFYPYSPPVPRAMQVTLNAAAAQAKARGFPVKIALIAAPTDLGVIPDLFGKPQDYAKFLDQEISFQGKQRLLVVMYDGYGLEGFDASAQAAARSIPKPAGKASTALASAALTALSRLAAASGHPLRGVAGAGQPASSESGRAALAIGLGVAAVIVAGALVVLRRRTAAGTPS